MSLDIELNSQQRAAVEFGEFDSEFNFSSQPLLILAGAGTGKTNTLAHRSAHLILNQVPPERILLMTFSRRAARELVERTKRIVIQQLPKNSSSNSSNNQKKIQCLQIPWMGTFHSIANRLLRQHGHLIGMESNFTIIDRNDSEDLLDVLRHELCLAKSTKRFPKKSTCLSIYSRCVNSQQALNDILNQEFPWCSEWETELKNLFGQYAERKIQQQSLDYDDLLLYWYHLSEIPDIQNHFRNEFDHILIDEFQDTNLLQAGILLRLFPDGRGLTVVGDDSQSIYSFRSAEVDNILKFPELFSPHATIIKLDLNYRSTQPILDLANQLLDDGSTGYKKRLVSQKKGQQKPYLVTVEDDMKQSQYIVEKVIRAREAGIELQQQAVLFRSSHHSDQLEVELMRNDIPFVKYGGLKFLEAAHVKDLISILRWAENPKHRISGFRVLKLLPGVGPSTAMKILDFLELNHYQFSSLISFSYPNSAVDYWYDLVNLLDAISGTQAQWPSQIEQARIFYEPLLLENYENDFTRTGDLEQLVQIAQQYPSRENFVSELTLDPPVASGELNSDAHKDDDFLILSTVHSAKGQEWKNVFILNVADGSFPNEYATGNEKSIEEERRLLNVAITRAKNDLHLIQPLKYWVPQQPKFGDKHVYGAKSRFLTDEMCQLVESTHWPSITQKVAEVTTNYSVIADVHSKIRDMW